MTLAGAGTTHATAETMFVEVAGIEFAYRRFGSPAGTPVVMLQHFRGNLDNWDPALTDALAAKREVILVDYPGVGLSTGEPGLPQTHKTPALAGVLFSRGDWI